MAPGEEKERPLSLANATVSDDILAIVPVRTARDENIVSLAATNNTVTVAMPNPKDLDLISKLEWIIGRRVIGVLAEPSELENAVRTFYGEDEGEVAECVDFFLSVEREKNDVCLPFEKGGRGEFSRG